MEVNSGIYSIRAARWIFFTLPENEGNNCFSIKLTKGISLSKIVYFYLDNFKKA